MLKNYLKILFRNALRNPVFTSINVLGLAVGIGACLIIILFVKEELSYDNFHPDTDRTFRVIHKRTYTNRYSEGAQMPVPFARAIEDQYSEIASILEVVPSQKKLFTYQEKEVYETKGVYTSSKFFEFFSIKFLEGLPNSSTLNAPYSMILTEKLALKYFGDNWREKNILSKTILINNQQEYAINGVIENPPSNFHLKFDYLTSISTRFLDLSDYSMSNWLSPRHYVYIKLFDASAENSVNEKLLKLTKKHVDPRTEDKGYIYNYFLQPLGNIHLYSAHLKHDFAERGNIIYVNSLIAIAALILLLACANFINISTVSASKRSKEVGLRKVSGASRLQIIIQFLGETVLTVLFSTIIGAFLVEILLGLFNHIVGKTLQFNLLSDTWILLMLGGVIIFTGVLAGGYTAFYISSVQPSRILKRDDKSLTGFSSIRKYLVVFQFSISVLLIMGSIVIYRQLQFTQNKNLGLNKEQILVLPIIGGKAQSHIKTYKTELSKISGVSSVSACYGLPGFFVQGDKVTVSERSELLSLTLILADESFLKTMEIKTIAGRDFHSNSMSDQLHSFIINETAAKMMGYTAEEAIGKPLEWELWIRGDSSKRGEIVGVTQDFHFRSLHEEIGPMLIHNYEPKYTHFAVKLSTDNLQQGIESVAGVYGNWTNNLPFQYHFLDDNFGNYYSNEAKFSILLRTFTGLAILIACLGLLGLTAYAAERRQKEIGIRKVHGASISNILMLLNSQFMRLVIISIFIAVPVGYYLSNLWLNNYAYHISIDWEIFAMTGLLGIGLAIITVSYFAMRAALTNPVDVLRNE